MTTSNIPMYTAAHHDRRNGMMFVWYADGSRQGYRVAHNFYTPNRGEYNSMPCGMRDIYGREMFLATRSGDEEMEIRKRHRGPNNYISECDIDFRTRWLQNHYSNNEDIRFDVNDFNVGYLDIEVETTDRFPTAERAERPVNCVTLYASKKKVYYVFGLGKELKPETYQKFKDNGLNVQYYCCQDEVQLLTRLFSCIGKAELDILMAWNGDWYDFPYLTNRAAKLNININTMSRLPAPYKTAYVSKQDNLLKIGGTAVIDQLKLFKKFTMGERDSYKLDDVGYAVTKQRKAPLPDGYHSYKNYWDDFVFYNIMDVKLAVDIEAEKRMVETTIGACSEARVPFESIFESKKMLVGFVLNYLHHQGIVFPPLRDVEGETFPGAYVYSTPGYYEWLVSYDYRSMYPSIMMGANISPETKVEYPIDAIISPEILKNLVRSPWTAHGRKQIFYRRDIVGIIPSVVKILFDGRTDLKNLMKKAKKNGDKALADYYNMKQNAYKIFGNSLYGLLGNSHFQFYDPDNSASVTAFGVGLITMTIDEYTKWLENDLIKDIRYEQVFGVPPTIDHKYDGHYVNDKDEKCPNRLSHGDTDSFFVKYDDLYTPFIERVGRQVDVLVFDGRKLIHKDIFHITDGDADARNKFTDRIDEFGCGAWTKMDDENRKKTMVDGIYYKGNYRIIYNTYSLTDYCRTFDAAILEEKLEVIMANYANKWNYKDNTLFLKREKCINKAIVTAKKKYICYVESNEDIKYVEPEFAITGLEIVRSSTTPFSRKYIQKMVTDLLNYRDKFTIKQKYFEVKKEFFSVTRSGSIYDISIPSGVSSDPPKYFDMINSPEERYDWRLRSASVWNHLIETDPVLNTMTLEPIYENSKVKFINVHPNRYGVTKIAFIGKECPQRIFELFTPDWDDQWDKTFGKALGRLFEAIGWDAKFEDDDRDLIRMMNSY